MEDQTSKLKIELDHIKNENKELKEYIDELEAYKDKLVLELENVVGY